MLSRQRGFTLIELIMVIVLLAIVATVSVRFVSLSVRGAIDTSARQRMAQAAAVINTQLSRALRNALPTSVRTYDSGRCIEFLPIRAASVYENIPIAVAADTFQAVAYSDSQSVTGRIVIYPVAGDPYTLGNPGTVSPPATLPPDSDSNGQEMVTLASDHRFVTDSPTRRFFMVGDPQAFCQSGPVLFQYQSYGYQTTASDFLSALPSTFAGGREVVASPMLDGSVRFSYSGPTLTRNGVVTFRYVIADADTAETLDIAQEVQIRNVP